MTVAVLLMVIMSRKLFAIIKIVMLGYCLLIAVSTIGFLICIPVKRLFRQHKSEKKSYKMLTILIVSTFGMHSVFMSVCIQQSILCALILKNIQLIHIFLMLLCYGVKFSEWQIQG